jgi:hypothetical protein
MSVAIVAAADWSPTLAGRTATSMTAIEELSVFTDRTTPIARPLDVLRLYLLIACRHESSASRSFNASSNSTSILSDFTPLLATSGADPTEAERAVVIERLITGTGLSECSF